MNNKFAELYSFIILVIGLILIIANFNIDAAMKNCVNQSIHTANRIILIISILAIMLTFGGLACRGVCHCTSGIYISTGVYMMFLLLLGSTILSLGIIMKTATKDKSCSEVTTDGWITAVIVLGCVLLLLPLLYLGRNLKFMRSA